MRLLYSLKRKRPKSDNVEHARASIISIDILLFCDRRIVIESVMSCQKGYRYTYVQCFRISYCAYILIYSSPTAAYYNNMCLYQAPSSLYRRRYVQTKWTAAAVTVKYGTRWHRLNTRRVSCSHLSPCAVLRAQNTQYTRYSLRHSYDVNYYSDLNPFNNIFITRTIAVPIEHL